MCMSPGVGSAEGMSFKERAGGIMMEGLKSRGQRKMAEATGKPFRQSQRMNDLMGRVSPEDRFSDLEGRITDLQGRLDSQGQQQETILAPRPQNPGAGQGISRQTVLG